LAVGRCRIATASSRWPARSTAKAIPKNRATAARRAAGRSSAEFGPGRVSRSLLHRRPAQVRSRCCVVHLMMGDTRSSYHHESHRSAPAEGGLLDRGQPCGAIRDAVSKLSARPSLPRWRAAQAASRSSRAATLLYEATRSTTRQPSCSSAMPCYARVHEGRCGGDPSMACKGSGVQIPSAPPPQHRRSVHFRLHAKERGYGGCGFLGDSWRTTPMTMARSRLSFGGKDDMCRDLLRLRHG
jgi:hypothetical protein